MRMPSRDEFIRKITQVQAEGQGVFQLEMVRHHDVPGLFLAAAAGDVRAIQICDLVGQFLRRIAAPGAPILCLLCDNELSPVALPSAILIMSARRDDPSMAIVNGLCAECAGKPDLEAAVLAKYRDSLIPDLRVLPPIGEAGRA
jgi:hypothetical protein